MDAEYKDIFTSIRVTEDTTNGLIKLEAVKRYGQDRNTKVKNNFVGQLSKADSSTLLQLARLLNEQLPPKTYNEVVVGLMTSGVIMCGYLALIRKSFFNYSIYSKFGDYEDEFSFSEGHRDDKKHYLYGIKPGDEIIIIEDEVTSGNGIIELVNAFREY